MGWSLVLGAILVALTHAIRHVGRIAGPRWSGLVLGLPCSTALVLVGSGLERGAGYATGLAESSMIGLVAAVALPLVYSMAVGRDWSWPWAMASALIGYVLVAFYAHSLPIEGLPTRIVLITGAVMVGWRLVKRLPVRQGNHVRGCVAGTRGTVLRTVVPLVCLGLVMTLRDTVGVEWSGLLSTFPGLTLALLIVTHLEAGPGEVWRMARAVPLGNLSMIAFLAIFRVCCPELGVALSTICAYAGAIATLIVVERMTRSTEGRAQANRLRPDWIARRLDQAARLPVPRLSSRRSRGCPSFRPRLEGLG